MVGFFNKERFIHLIYSFGSLLFISFLLLTCSGSKDNDPEPPGNNDYFKCKVDGKEYLIKGSDRDSFLSCRIVGTQYFSVFAHDGRLGVYPAMGFDFQSTERITTKEYSSSDMPAPFPKIVQWVLPIDDVLVKYTLYDHSETFKVNIAEITLDRVKGTFSGKMLGEKGTIQITDGEFSVTRTD